MACGGNVPCARSLSSDPIGLDVCALPVLLLLLLIQCRGRSCGANGMQCDIDSTLTNVSGFRRLRRAIREEKTGPPNAGGRERAARGRRVWAARHDADRQTGRRAPTPTPTPTAPAAQPSPVQAHEANHARPDAKAKPGMRAQARRQCSTPRHAHTPTRPRHVVLPIWLRLQLRLRLDIDIVKATLEVQSRTKTRPSIAPPRLSQRGVCDYIG